jgi:hypothetical protein
MSDAVSTAMLVLGDDVRKEIGAKLGLGADQLDGVPMAIEISLPDVEGFTAGAVRLSVRSILTSSPSFRSLPPESQKELAHNTVRVL